MTDAHTRGMRAVALVAPGQVEIVDDWPEPEPGPDDVVVQIRGVGLCGSDLSVYDGTRQVPGLPWVFGHEGGGDIVAAGTGVTGREIGQRVVIEPNFADGTCAACLAGHTSACDDRQVLAITRTGILAERVAVPADYTWPVSSDWPDVALACVEPLVVAHTAVRRADVPVGADCLVIGAGSQGQLVCQSLLAAGAQPYVMEPHPGRLELAMKLGARPAEEHDGDTYPLVFETAGVPAVWEPAYNAVAKTGKLVVIGFNDNAGPAHHHGPRAAADHDRRPADLRPPGGLPGDPGGGHGRSARARADRAGHLRRRGDRGRAGLGPGDPWQVVDRVLELA